LHSYLRDFLKSSRASVVEEFDAESLARGERTVRTICRNAAALISLLLVPAPATALDILSGLGGNGLDIWSDLEPIVLEFDDDDWALFVTVHTSDDFPPALDTPEDDSDPVEG
jgi:hypothetical protein